jgi:hypothetical protein
VDNVAFLSVAAVGAVGVLAGVAEVLRTSVREAVAKDMTVFLSGWVLRGQVEPTAAGHGR